MITITEGNKRLLELADLLGTIPKGVFNLHSWFIKGNYKRSNEDGWVDTMGGADREKMTLLGMVKVVDGLTTFVAPPDVAVMSECGFAACAVGWASVHPPFAAAGLSMVAKPAYGDNVCFEPYYNGALGHYAVNQFFSLEPNSNDWIYLFNPLGYSRKPTAEVVAKRIRSYVARREAGKRGTPSQWSTHYTGW